MLNWTFDKLENCWRATTTCRLVDSDMMEFFIVLSGETGKEARPFKLILPSNKTSMHKTQQEAFDQGDIEEEFALEMERDFIRKHPNKAAEIMGLEPCEY